VAGSNARRGEIELKTPLQKERDPRGVGESKGDDVLSKSVMEIMASPVWTLQVSDSLRKAFHLLSNARVRHAPVLKGDRLVGILSERDVRMYLPPPSQRGGKSGQPVGEAVGDETRVYEMMTGDPVSIGPYHSVTAAARVLLERRIGALPVVDEGRVVGIVTQTDILRAMLEHVEELKDSLASSSGSLAQRRAADKERRGG
jgi:acetoin utilization protein AcuB